MLQPSTYNTVLQVCTPMWTHATKFFVLHNQNRLIRHCTCQRAYKLKPCSASSCETIVVSKSKILSLSKTVSKTTISQKWICNQVKHRPTPTGRLHVGGTVYASLLKRNIVFTILNTLHVTIKSSNTFLL